MKSKIWRDNAQHCNEKQPAEFQQKQILKMFSIKCNISLTCPLGVRTTLIFNKTELKTSLKIKSKNDLKFFKVLPASNSNQ